MSHYFLAIVIALGTCSVSQAGQWAAGEDTRSTTSSTEVFRVAVYATNPDTYVSELYSFVYYSLHETQPNTPYSGVTTYVWKRSAHVVIGNYPNVSGVIEKWNGSSWGPVQSFNYQYQP